MRLSRDLNEQTCNPSIELSKIPAVQTEQQSKYQMTQPHKFSIFKTIELSDDSTENATIKPIQESNQSTDQSKVPTINPNSNRLAI